MRDAQLATGLWHLHDVGLTHGDIKPENVLLSALPGSKEAVRARLADFGLADARASLSGASRLSTVQMTNEKRGTKPYMAPEMFREGGGVAGGGVAGGVGSISASATQGGGSRTSHANGSGGSNASGASGASGASPSAGAVAAASRSTDVYALGTLFWEVLTGLRPWDGFDETTRLLLLRTGGALDLALLPAATPPAVRELLLRCLALDRAERPRMGEVRATLEREHEVLSSGHFDVFLSYAWGARSARVPLADALYAALRGAGFRVWLDRNELGHDLHTGMCAGIASSAVVVALLSPDYAASAACMFELRQAAEAGRPVVACAAEPGFWRSWLLADGMTRAVPEGHDMVRLARLTTHLFVDLGDASKVDWTQAPVPPEERRRLTHAEAALPRLLRLVKEATAGLGAAAGPGA